MANDKKKPKKTTDLTKPNAILNHLQEEVAMLVPDYSSYVVLQISGSEPYQLFYNISNTCPIDKHQKIQKVILENAALLNLHVTTEIE